MIQLLLSWFDIFKISKDLRKTDLIRSPLFIVLLHIFSAHPGALFCFLTTISLSTFCNFFLEFFSFYSIMITFWISPNFFSFSLFFTAHLAWMNFIIPITNSFIFGFFASFLPILGPFCPSAPSTLVNSGWKEKAHAWVFQIWNIKQISGLWQDFMFSICANLLWREIVLAFFIFNYRLKAILVTLVTRIWSWLEQFSSSHDQIRFQTLAKFRQDPVLSSHLLLQLDRTYNSCHE